MESCGQITGSTPSLISWLRRLDRALFDHDHYPRLLERLIGDCETLLDVGCGSYSAVRLATPRIEYSLGIDGFAPSIARSRSAGIHRDYQQMDIRDLSRFSDGQFDVVVCSDVIEHLPKEEGFALMRELERIASKRVIVATPHGFMPQDGSLDGNCLQAHVSGWRIWDFVDRGYQVTGFGGWKPLKGDLAMPKWKPLWFWWRIVLLTEVLLRGVPGPSFHLVAMKAKGANS